MKLVITRQNFLFSVVSTFSLFYYNPWSKSYQILTLPVNSVS